MAARTTIESFSSRPSPKLVFGPGTLRELAGCVREVGGSRVFLVSDPGLLKAGHAQRALRLLEDAGLRPTLFAEARENPTESDAADCADAIRANPCDCLVALGGGSSLDTAKAANFLLTNGGRMRDYHGYGKASRPMLPLIAIPTSAGTGSECQSYALVSRDDTHEKMACGDPKARPYAAILDPDLTATLPQSVAILSGLDALTHAIESAVCTQRNPISSLYSEAAFHHLAFALERVIEGRASQEDRGHMLLGAALAGLAIENSMLGAAHASANPLTARHGVVHGHAVALMLPPVMRFNASVPAAAGVYAHFETILRDIGEAPGLALVEWVESLVTRSRLPRLDPLSMDFTALAQDALRQWTGRFNPRTLQAADFVSLYRDALASAASSVK